MRAQGWFRGEAFGSILSRHRGVGPGFDLLRIALALAIFYGHTITVGGAVEAAMRVVAATHPLAEIRPLAEGWEGVKRPFHVALVPMFFALSGFLVTGSALRLPRVSTFLANRILRIMPALAVELTLSAFLIGAVFTTLPLTEYVTSAGLWAYFGNLVGIVDFELPGVFASSPMAGIVNQNLWTLPAELDCYLFISIAIVAGLLKRRMTFTAILVAASIVLVVLNTVSDFAVTSASLPLHTFTYYFFVGVAFFLWRDVIPFSWSLFVLCGGLAYAFLLSRHTVYLAPIFLTYCTIFIGMLKLPKISFISRGDYSYGLYLYGFPISQAVLAAFPALRGHWWIVLAIAAPATAAFAALSWHFIEKPTLALKRHLPSRWFPTGREFARDVGQPMQRPAA